MLTLSHHNCPTSTEDYICALWLSPLIQNFWSGVIRKLSEIHSQNLPLLYVPLLQCFNVSLSEKYPNSSLLNHLLNRSWKDSFTESARQNNTDPISRSDKCIVYSRQKSFIWKLLFLYPVIPAALICLFAPPLHHYVNDQRLTNTQNESLSCLAVSYPVAVLCDMQKLTHIL